MIWRLHCFFATCKYDTVTKQWYPLTKADTEVNESTKYGVIFHIPGNVAEYSQMMAGTTHNSNVNAILPIGYQPFMRCHSQHGYAINMKTPFPLQDDSMFEKLRFRHDERISREIYEKLDCGKRIYPQEGLNRFDDIIDKIRKTTVFSKEAYRITLNHNPELTDDKVQELLKKCDCVDIFGSIIVISEEEPIKVSRQRIRAINRRYERFSIEKKYGINLTSRLIYGSLPVRK